jgi:nucleotidyltransferase/DNA polymerase involved in DNA repair
MESPGSLTEDSGDELDREEPPPQPQQEEEEEVEEEKNGPVVHLDLDNFFVQVERKLDPTLRGVPVCVQQHDDIIAVSAEAKKIGIKKHCSPAAARAQFPMVRLVHVATDYGSKVTYRHYREASDAVSAVLSAELSIWRSRWRLPAGALPLEKGSIDEFYVDASSCAEFDGPSGDPKLPFVLGHLPKHPALACCEDCGGETRLRAADELAARLRVSIQRDLGFAISTGCAPNKIMAKLACGTKKGDSRAILFAAHIPHVLQNTKLGELPYVGVRVTRKRADTFDALLKERLILGNAGDWRQVSICDVQALPLDDLTAALGGEIPARWVFNACRGRDESTVLTTGPPRTIQSSMSLQMVTEARGGSEELRKVVGWVVAELVERLVADGRQPTTVSLAFRIFYPPKVPQKPGDPPVPYSEAHNARFPLKKVGFGTEPKSELEIPVETLVDEGMRHFHSMLNGLPNSGSHWQVRWVGGQVNFVAPVTSQPSNPLREPRAELNFRAEHTDADALDILESARGSKRVASDSPNRRQARLTKFFRTTPT